MPEPTEPTPDGQQFVITFTASAEVTPAAETNQEN
jgi:hypothetical protein